MVMEICQSCIWMLQITALPKNWGSSSRSFRNQGWNVISISNMDFAKKTCLQRLKPPPPKKKLTSIIWREHLNSTVSCSVPYNVPQECGECDQVHAIESLIFLTRRWGQPNCCRRGREWSTKSQWSIWGGGGGGGAGQPKGGGTCEWQRSLRTTNLKCLRESGSRKLQTISRTDKVRILTPSRAPRTFSSCMWTR